MSYDWLMVVFGNHQPIVNNAGHPKDTIKPTGGGKLVRSLPKVSGAANSELS